MPFCRGAMWVDILAAKWRHTQAWRIKKRILRLKYLRSKYRLELCLCRFGHDVNRTYCSETHSYLCVNSANILHNRCLLAASCGKLWIFVESRLEVIPVFIDVHHVSDCVHADRARQLPVRPATVQISLGKSVNDITIAHILRIPCPFGGQSWSIILQSYQLYH